MSTDTLTTTNTIRANVHQILTLARVAFAAEYRGLRKNALGGSHPMDEWLCTLTFEGKPREPEEFEFFTGISLRAEPTPRDRQQAKARFQLPDLTENDITRHTIYGRRYMAALEEMRKPQAPHAADVLHSLLMDSDAVGQSFESWCSEYGYDSDSRKAEAIYHACQANADKLARVIKPETLRELREALADY